MEFFNIRHGFDVRQPEKFTDVFTELGTVKVGGSNIIGLQKWMGPVPPTYNASDAHVRAHVFWDIFSLSHTRGVKVWLVSIL